MTDRTDLRRTFADAAELYDRMRPRYPDRLLTDLAVTAGLTAGAHVLEIGCGTGQATVALAQRGYAIVAVELSGALAALAARNVAPFPRVRIVTADFDEWPVPVARFDLVASFTAWHWLDPELRMAKAADALRVGGTLAVVATHHVAGGTEEFFVRAQECYEQWDPKTPPGLRLPPAASLPADSSEFAACGRFGRVEHRRYAADITYTRAEYLDLLSTYSGHIALAPQQRQGLYACLGALIDDQFAGAITKRYLFEVSTAQKQLPS
jgi:SAM-dependent methyltransferase